MLAASNRKRVFFIVVSFVYVLFCADDYAGQKERKAFGFAFPCPGRSLFGTKIVQGERGNVKKPEVFSLLPPSRRLPYLKKRQCGREKKEKARGLYFPARRVAGIRKSERRNAVPPLRARSESGENAAIRAGKAGCENGKAGRRYASRPQSNGNRPLSHGAACRDGGHGRPHKAVLGGGPETAIRFCEVPDGKKAARACDKTEKRYLYTHKSRGILPPSPPWPGGCRALSVPFSLCGTAARPAQAVVCVARTASCP